MKLSALTAEELNGKTIKGRTYMEIGIVKNA
jgi:hypothetical protein